MTDQTYRDIPRHRGALASRSVEHPHPPRPGTTNQTKRTEIRTHGFTATEQALIEASEQRHARGIPILGRIAGGGHIPGTNPGRHYCADCGATQGHHHHRTCTHTGRLP